MSSPHVPTQRRLFFDASPNVDTDYWFIVVFLKQTAAIKVEAPPTSLIFDVCHSGAPNKGTGAGERKTDGSRPAHIHLTQISSAHGDRGAKPPEGGRRLLILVVVCCGCVLCCGSRSR